MAGIDPRLTPLPGDRPPPAPAPAPYPPLYPPGAPPNTPGAPNPTTPVRTAVKPRNGGILKDAVGNETPFTGKGRSLTLANGQTQQVPASAWATRPEQDQRFYRDFENKLEKGTGVEYSGNTSTDKKGVSLDDWRKVLLKSVLQLGLDGVFTVLVDGKEVNVIDNYAPFNYELCEAIHKRRTDNGEYDYYDTYNLEYSCTLINNSVDAEVISSLEKYTPAIDFNGFLTFAAIMATFGPATEAAARNHVTDFQALDFLSYPQEDVDAYLGDVKKHLEAVESMMKSLIPKDAPSTIVLQLSQSSVNPFTTKLLAQYPSTGQDTTNQLTMTNVGVVSVKGSKFTWREVVTWASSEYSALKKAKHWPPARGTSVQDENTQLKGMMAEMKTEIVQLRNDIGKRRNTTNGTGGGGGGGGGNSGGGGGGSRQKSNDGGGSTKPPKKGSILADGCLVCGNPNHWLKDCDAGHIPKFIPPEGKGPTSVKTPTGTFDLCRKCGKWYKQGKKAHHTTDTHVSKKAPNQDAGEEEKKQVGNMAQQPTSDHPDDQLMIFHED